MEKIQWRFVPFISTCVSVTVETFVFLAVWRCSISPILFFFDRPDYFFFISCIAGPPRITRGKALSKKRLERHGNQATLPLSTVWNDIPICWAFLCASASCQTESQNFHWGQTLTPSWWGGSYGHFLSYNTLSAWKPGIRWARQKEMISVWTGGICLKETPETIICFFFPAHLFSAFRK